MTQLVRIHGLLVDSFCSLPGQPVSDTACLAEVDVRILVDDGLQPRPADEVLARVDDPDRGRRYELRTCVTGGWEFEFPGTALVAIDRDLVEMRVSVPAGDPADLAPLIAGPVLTAIALLRGSAVLHASAVVRGSQAIAFTGPAGSGKSTMASLAGERGFRLFTDDALVATENASAIVAERGTLRARMRGSGTLAGAAVARSSDGRFLYETPGGLLPDRASLRSVLLPRLSPGVDRVRLVSIPPSQAVVALAGLPALEGVCSAALLERQFDCASRIVRGVRVHQLAVPWGPGVAPGGVGDELAAVLDSLLAGAAHEDLDG